MKAYMVTLYIWAFFSITAILFFPFVFIIWLITWPMDKEHIRFHFFTGRWANLYIRANPWWKLTLSGREKINPQATYVIVSNHQSMLDILALYQLRSRFKWVSKIEVFKVPILGWIMRMNNYIQLIRGNPESSIKMMQRCKEEIAKGISVLMFPEGTRSPDSTLLPFKEGAFRLALDTKTNILPVIIQGASQSLPKKGILIRQPQTISIKVLNVIPFQNFENKAPDLLAVEVRELMQSNMNHEQ
jgi:1-acyl-sn-glycerol-3-phosphate acyltransferase